MHELPLWQGTRDRTKVEQIWKLNPFISYTAQFDLQHASFVYLIYILQCFNQSQRKMSHSMDECEQWQPNRRANWLRFVFFLFALLPNVTIRSLGCICRKWIKTNRLYLYLSKRIRIAVIFGKQINKMCGKSVSLPTAFVCTVVFARCKRLPNNAETFAYWFLNQFVFLFAC